MKKLVLLFSTILVSLSLSAGIDMQAHIASDEGKAAYPDFEAKQTAYYTGSYTYSILSSQTDTELFGLLNTLMGNTTRIGNSSYSYQTLRDEYINVDRDLNAAGKIIGYYDGRQMNGAWGSGYNREHTWPQSKGADKSTPMGHDMQSVRPTSTSVNSDRGNDAYGESGSYYDPDDVTINNSNYKKTNLGSYRGDCARVILYDYITYGKDGDYQNKLYLGNAQLFNKLGKSGVFESLAILLKWHMQDPPSLTEMVRNDGGEVYQGNRNPFIDYPELAINLLKEESGVTVYDVVKNTTAEINPNYSYTTPAGFITYLTFSDGTHPEAANLTVTGGIYTYDATLGRLIISSATSNVTIKTENDPEATKIDKIPVSNTICYTLNGKVICDNLPENSTISVFDITGQLRETRTNCAESEVFNLSQGVYVLRVVADNDVQSLKVITK